MQKSYANDLSELARLGADIEAFCQEHAIGFEDMNALQLCLDEAATNIISYAWPEKGGHAFEVSLVREGAQVRATLRDDGVAFDPLSDAPPPDLDSGIDEREIGGLGIHFCRTLMQELSYRREDEKFNVFTMTRLLAQ